MVSGFPDAAREAVRRLFVRRKEFEQITSLPKKTARAEEIMAVAENFNYGFRDMLEEGNYAPYLHEMRQQGIATYNCTTIIPTIYIFAQAADLDPKIILFEGLREK